MSCKNILNHIESCQAGINPRLTIENAGLMIGIDLTKPIDLSQTPIVGMSELMETDEYSGKIYLIRAVGMRCFITNEKGEEEELTIDFKLTSQRRAKIK